jgi:capsular polysaccharide transport system permease protein
LKNLLFSFLSCFKNGLFVATVFIPTLIATIYYSTIASDIFISEARFVVRSPQRQQNTNVLGSILSGSGFSRALDDSFSIHEFILSRDALSELNEKLELKKKFSDSKIDFLNRFPGPISDDSFEAFFKYYLKQITVTHDGISNITALKVHAFSADQAYDINQQLLILSERLVNQINDRARLDSVKYAQAEVAEAERRAKEATLALVSYRNQRSVFDPDRQSALQLQQISKLQDELISAKMQFNQVRSLSPDNPQIGVLQKRVYNLQSEIDTETAKITGIGNNTLSNKSADFEKMNLERAFADRQLASAMATLENAKNESRRKALYLETVVQPSKPDAATEPKRIKSILTTLAFGMLCWAIFSLLISGVKEHTD